jgi:polar amino acid transport system substrate-binding protein
MKKKVTIFVLILSLILLFGCTQQIVKPTPTPVLDRIMQKGELVVGTAASMPPLNMTTKKGEIIGFEIDLGRMMASAMGVKLRLEPMEFSKLLPALENGKVDMVLSGMTITPARNLKVAFVGPYFISGKAFLTKIETIAKAKDATEVNSPNVRLTALRGSTSQYFVEQVLPKVQLVPAKDYDEAVKLVIQGKVNAMIADYPICVISVYRYPNEGLLSVITPLTYEPLGIAVPSYDPHLVNWLENFLASLEETGGMDELKARWFGDASWLDQLP